MATDWSGVTAQTHVQVDGDFSEQNSGVKIGGSVQDSNITMVGSQYNLTNSNVDPKIQTNVYYGMLAVRIITGCCGLTFFFLGLFLISFGNYIKASTAGAPGSSDGQDATNIMIASGAFAIVFFSLTVFFFLYTIYSKTIQSRLQQFLEVQKLPDEKPHRLSSAHARPL